MKTRSPISAVAVTLCLSSLIAFKTEGNDQKRVELVEVTKGEK